MKEILFIDGYNIINSWFNLGDTPKGYELESARAKLVEIMAQYQVIKDIKIIIVYDAYKVKNGIEYWSKIDNVDIVFTKEGETADNFIERCVSSFKNDYRVRVATSDRMEQLIIFAQGGERVTPMELKAEIYETFKAIEKYKRMTYKDGQSLEIQLDAKTKELFKKWAQE